MKKESLSDECSSSHTHQKREFDIILFGATGYMGYLIAKYLLEHYGLNRTQDSLRWAIAGRNRTKLEILQERLDVWLDEKNRRESNELEDSSENGGIDILVVDSSNKEELRALTDRATVLISTVGPYLKYGLPLVQACAESGTDYVDLTGEIPFIKASFERFDAIAKENGARIVHGCAFDALPSDIAVGALQRFLHDTKGEFVAEIQGVVVKASGGGISSGTASSIANLFEWAEKHPDERDLLTAPYPLNNDNAGLPDVKESGRAYRDHFLNCWVVPMATSFFNAQIVRKSNELLDYAYGRFFLYKEGIQGPELIKKGWVEQLSDFVPSTYLRPVECSVNAISAGTLSLGISAFTHLLAYKKPRDIIRNVSKYMADLPGEEKEEDGSLEMIFSARSRGEEIARLTLESDLDPGYRGSAVMIVEMALSLLEMRRDHGECPQRTGILTPSAAVDNATFVARLEETGHFTFKAELCDTRDKEAERERREREEEEWDAESY